MENTLQYDEIEKTLFHQLSNTNMDKVQLSNVSKSIAALTRSGLQVIDWSWFGTPVIDKFVVDTHLAIDKVSSLHELIANNNFKDILLLRKGIPPMPYFINAKFTVDAKIQQQ